MRLCCGEFIAGMGRLIGKFENCRYVLPGTCIWPVPLHLAWSEVPEQDLARATRVQTLIEQVRKPQSCCC